MGHKHVASSKPTIVSSIVLPRKAKSCSSLASGESAYSGWRRKPPDIRMTIAVGAAAGFCPGRGERGELFESSRLPTTRSRSSMAATLKEGCGELRRLDQAPASLKVGPVAPEGGGELSTPPGSKS